MRDFLERLRRRWRLHIVSSNREGALAVYLRNNDLEHIFEEVLGLETDKSKVRKFKLLFEKHGFSNRDCLFVTDTLGDIREAHQVGVETIAVDFGFHDRARLSKGAPSAIVSDFDELFRQIEKHRLSRLKQKR